MKDEAVWILSRKPIISDSLIKQIEGIIKKQIPNYDVNWLMKTRQGMDCEYKTNYQPSYPQGDVVNPYFEEQLNYKIGPTEEDLYEPAKNPPMPKIDPILLGIEKEPMETSSTMNPQRNQTAAPRHDKTLKPPADRDLNTSNTGKAHLHIPVPKSDEFEKDYPGIEERVKETAPLNMEDRAQEYIE